MTNFEHICSAYPSTLILQNTHVIFFTLHLIDTHEVPNFTSTIQGFLLLCVCYFKALVLRATCRANLSSQLTCLAEYGQGQEGYMRIDGNGVLEDGPAGVHKCFVRKEFIMMFP